MMRREAERQLRRGEPWRAMALSEGLEPTTRDAVLAVAETQLALLGILCSDAAQGCSPAAMRDEAARVMGEPWTKERERAMTVQRPARIEAEPACGWGPEALTSGPETALGMLVGLGGRAPKKEEARALARRLVEESEGDLTMGCQVHLRVELLVQLLADLDLQRMSERMTQSTVQRSAATLETKAELALASRLGERAWEFTRAAAAEAADPGEVYRRAAERGRRWGVRDYELSARLRLTALEPESRSGDQARAVLAIRFADLFRSDLLKGDWEVAVEAWRHDFELHLARWPLEARWGESRRLALELWERAPMDEKERAQWKRELEALFGTSSVAAISALPPEPGADLMLGRVAPTVLQSEVGRMTVGGSARRQAAFGEVLASLAESGRYTAHQGLVELFVLGGTALSESGEPRPLLEHKEDAWRLAFGLR